MESIDAGQVKTPGEEQYGMDLWLRCLLDQCGECDVLTVDAYQGGVNQRWRSVPTGQTRDELGIGDHFLVGSDGVLQVYRDACAFLYQWITGLDFPIPVILLNAD